MWLLLLFPSLALASINLTLEGSIFFDETNTCTGSFRQRGLDERVVSDYDLAALNITKDLLKDAIEKIHGKRPDDVLVRSDSNFGVVYKKQNWNQVKRKLEPDVEDYKFEFSNQKVVLTEGKYNNPTNKRKVFQISEAQIINDVVKSTWSMKQFKGQNVHVVFDLDIDGEYQIEYDRTFAIGNPQRFVVHKPFAENRSLELNPKQSVKARLTATKGIIKIVIPYKLSLSGDVVAKYAAKYKDQYFFKFDINKLVDKSVTVEQIFTYEYHYDTQLHILDANDIVLRSFATKHADTQSSGKRKAAAEKKYESAGGIKLRQKAIPRQLLDLIENEVYDTVVEHEENEESGETA